jgi:hypothetical protein
MIPVSKTQNESDNINKSGKLQSCTCTCTYADYSILFYFLFLAKLPVSKMLRGESKHATLLSAALFFLKARRSPQGRVPEEDSFDPRFDNRRWTDILYAVQYTVLTWKSQ